jgi:O-antigen/teichoic acid export membrane protein
MGIYALVVRLLKWPMGLVGTSMSQVFFQEAAEKFANKEDIVPLITRTLWPLIKLGLPLLLIFMFVAEDLINLVFSEKWSAAGEYAQILAPWLFLNFLISPISQIPNIVNKQKQVFLLSLFGFSAALGSLVLGSFLFDEVLQTFMLFSAVQSVYLFFVILWIRFIAIKAQTDRA